LILFLSVFHDSSIQFALLNILKLCFFKFYQRHDNKD
jgi:hypothetical protein